MKWTRKYSLINLFPKLIIYSVNYGLCYFTLGGFKDPALYTSWLEPDNAFSVWKTQRAFNKYEKSAALVSNSQFLVKPLDMIVGKAWNMFASK